MQKLCENNIRSIAKLHKSKDKENTALAKIMFSNIKHPFKKIQALEKELLE